MTPKEIAEKYVYGDHDALTDKQEVLDMIKDIEEYTLQQVNSVDLADVVGRSEQLCGCDYPLIRTSEKNGEYCGLCEKDLD
jgi:hypothetical protein